MHEYIFDKSTTISSYSVLSWEALEYLQRSFRFLT